MVWITNKKIIHKSAIYLYSFSTQIRYTNNHCCSSRNTVRRQGKIHSAINVCWIESYWFYFYEFVYVIDQLWKRIPIIDMASFSKEGIFRFAGNLAYWTHLSRSISFAHTVTWTRSVCCQKCAVFSGVECEAIPELRVEILREIPTTHTMKS